MRKREDGFTLIEIVVTLVLVGILSAFVGLFMTTFMKGYFMVKNNSDTAMKAQMALDRISLELRDATAFSVLTDNSLVTYKNTQMDPLGADRTIKFVGSNLYLSTPANNILIDNVQAFTLSATTGNVYGDTVYNNDVVAFIDIVFTVSGYNPFSTRIFPRTRITHP
jgi:prepilin-type N-terminal cleavage/methylation domain-containing protein